MPKTQSFIVKDTTIRSFTQNGFDYLCITDIARQRNSLEPNVVVGNWMRNRNTIEYLGMWEMLNNPDFNPIEFEGVRSQAGLNAFTLSPSRWIEPPVSRVPQRQGYRAGLNVWLSNFIY